MEKKPHKQGAGDEASNWLKRVAESGDRAAFIALFNYFAPRLKSYLLRQGLSRQAADDLVQEVMFQVWRSAAQFDAKKARASTWIYTIARNRLIDQRRRQKNSPIAAEVPVADEAGYEIQPDLERRSEDARVRQAIAALPPEQRTLVEESYFDGQSHSRIAESRHLPLGTVKSRLRLAMQRLRENLRGET
ncbi:MAG TPA: sigma-70 family RNA polymerase sigma factor [Alphaproteobacteria bacterium]|nr:sigma-70 family RNA polymerase sigma factor [Alphaproteobacteria bacterium]